MFQYVGQAENNKLNKYNDSDCWNKNNISEKWLKIGGTNLGPGSNDQFVNLAEKLYK